MSAEKVNEAIHNSVFSIYERFASEVEAKDVVDFLLHNNVFDKESKEKIMKRRTKEDRCGALLSQLFLSSHEAPFIALRDALEYKYPAIVECIDEVETNYPKLREINLQRKLSIGADGTYESLKMCFNCVELEKDMKVKFAAVERRLQRLESELNVIRKEKHELTEKSSFLQNSIEHANAEDQTLETNTVHRRQPFEDKRVYENVYLNTESQEDKNPAIYSTESEFPRQASSDSRSPRPFSPSARITPPIIPSRKEVESITPIFI